MILHGVGIFDIIVNFEYLRENETKFENILTHWSVAQAGSNDEKKKLGWKISLDCPFTYININISLLPSISFDFLFVKII